MNFREFYSRNPSTISPNIERLANLVRTLGRQGFQIDHENGLFDFEWKFSKRINELPETAQRRELQFLSQTQKELAHANPDEVENLFVMPPDNSILSIQQLQKSLQQLIKHFRQPTSTDYRP